MIRLKLFLALYQFPEVIIFLKLGNFACYVGLLIHVTLGRDYQTFTAAASHSITGHHHESVTEHQLV